MHVNFKHVDAFTDTPLTGNPAGVVLDARPLTDQQMQSIARELAMSETAFVLPPTTPAAQIRLRWFTPTVEVALCGHATIAAFHALAESGFHGMEKVGTFSFRVETRSGILPVTVEKGESTISVLFGLPVPEFTRAGQHKLDVMRILNINLEELENRIPIVAGDDLFVPMKRLHSIFALKPNFSAMSHFLTNRRLRGLCVFTLETVDRTSTFHSRFFAPHIGINEDPVTGSANGPLAVYLFERGALETSGEEVAVTGEQGDPIGRRGRVNVRLGVHGAQVLSVLIGGRAVTLYEGTLLIG